MSACLFIQSGKSIAEASINELKSLIEEQTKYTTNYNINNRFECDRACGFSSNVLMAKLELEARNYFDVETISALVLREGFSLYDFAMRAAVSKFHKTRQSVHLVYDGNLRITDKEEV